MKKSIKTFLITIAALILSSSMWGQTLLNPEVQTKVMNSVFEVVVDKVESTNITYEKKLPLERIPFAIRNDKYISIGTAFLMEDGKFYSASHVFNLFHDSVYKNYYIRDAKGQTFKVNQITSLSNQRDFISFTVENFQIPENSGLKAADHFQLNTTVYSVGNAQGQGVIIRNGMITSQTPEDLNGEWNWLRFSAAASPGNSGGPLISEEGDVIGIITMKNETENLNYALPFSETETGKNGKGIIDYHSSYGIPNLLPMSKYFELKLTIQLPSSYEAVHKQIMDAYNKKLQEVVAEIRKEYNPDAPKGFGRSKEFPFFNNAYSSDTPMTIYLGDSGSWDMSPGETRTYMLKDNGSIEYGYLMRYYIFTITKPDSQSLEDLITNPKGYMDELSKVINLNRTIAGEKIAITSFGEPEKSETYRDYFGRTWYVNYFAADFTDQMLLSFALPLPTGLYVFVRLTSRGTICSSTYLDMQFVADHTYTEYFGEVRNWKEYLALSEKLEQGKSEMEKQFAMEYSDEKLVFSTENMKISITPDLMPLTDENRICSTNAFVLKNNKVVQEARGLTFYSKPKTEDFKYAYVCKIPKPLPGAAKKLNEKWNQQIGKVAPYNSEPYNYGSSTYLDTIMYEGENPSELYLYSFELINQNQFEEVKAFGEKIIENIEIK